MHGSPCILAYLLVLVMHCKCLFLYLFNIFIHINTIMDSSGVSNLYVSDYICDHRDLHVSLTCNKAHPECKQIDVRWLKRIECDVLESDLFGVNIDSEYSILMLKLVHVNMMRHLHIYWINMHHQNVFMVLKNL